MNKINDTSLAYIESEEALEQGPVDQSWVDARDQAHDAAYNKFEGYDPEVFDLCEAMNDLPGVTSFESCCGHGERPFRIWFRVDEGDHDGLFILTRSADRRYFNHGNEWTITLGVADFPESPLPLTFLLESTVVGEEAYNQAQELVANILHHRKHKAFLEGYGLQKHGLQGCALEENP